jgi:hypothetical protein
VDEDAGALGEGGHGVLIDDDLGPFSAGDVGELVLDQAAHDGLGQLLDFRLHQWGRRRRRLVLGLVGLWLGLALLGDLPCHRPPLFARLSLLLVAVVNGNEEAEAANPSKIRWIPALSLRFPATGPGLQELALRGDSLRSIARLLFYGKKIKQKKYFTALVNCTVI